MNPRDDLLLLAVKLSMQRKSTTTASCGTNKPFKETRRWRYNREMVQRADKGGSAGRTDQSRQAIALYVNSISMCKGHIGVWRWLLSVVDMRHSFIYFFAPSMRHITFQGDVCPHRDSSQTVSFPLSFTEAGPIDRPCQELEFGIRRHSVRERKEVNQSF